MEKKTNKRKILNFGSLNIDRVYQVPAMVKAGETISALELDFFAGGKGLNSAVALGRAGAAVWMAGGVGAADGDSLITSLEAAGVNTSLIERRPVPSGHAVIQVDPQGENCIIISGGANQQNTSDYIQHVIGRFAADDFVILQNEINGNATIMRAAAARGLKIFLNPSPMTADIHTLPLEQVFCFVLNQHEAEAMTEASATEDQLAVLHRCFPKAMHLITRGSESAVCLTAAGEVHDQPVFPAEAVDTTAAGDTFTGYFVAALAADQPVQEALCRAAAAASITVSRLGAAASIPTSDEVEALLSQI